MAPRKKPAGKKAAASDAKAEAKAAAADRASEIKADEKAGRPRVYRLDMGESLPGPEPTE